MTLRRPLTLSLSLLLLPACPDDGDDNTTEASSSTAGTTTNDGPTTSTGQPPATDSSGPGNTSDPDSTSSSGSTSMAASTTDAPTIACEDATTEEQCTAAGSFETSCGWFPTRHFSLVDMMCMEVAQGGVCLTTSQGDETCGITLDSSCMEDEIVVYVRPSMEVDGAFETLQLGTSDACTGPDPGDGWEVCVPAMMMMGCRCGCS
jgi:hypothetical protein